MILEDLFDELLPIFTAVSSAADIVAIINGASKKGLRSGEKIHTAPLSIDAIYSTHPGHSIELAKAAALGGARTIIAVGGDGTVNEVVNGVLQAKKEKPDIDPALCIYPAGTANDFAHTIGAKADLELLKSVLSNEKTQRVDAGKVSAPNGAVRYFLNIASLGLGARVVQNMWQSKKPFGADLSFLWAVTRTFFGYKRTKVKCLMDRVEWSGETLAIAVANGKRFGSGIFIAPHAEMNDGLLEVVILGKISSLDYLRNIGKLKKGKRVEHPEAHYFQCRSISIETLEGETMLETDGELIGELPRTIEVLPDAINLLVWPRVVR